MLNDTPILTKNESERIYHLSKFDFDYATLEDDFKDVTKLAAKIAGTSVSLINLIDSFTQWTIANEGLSIRSMPREDSVCQYTIASEEDHFEIKDLADDNRFKNKFYVAEPYSFRYYFGIPLKIDNGSCIGALCILDKHSKQLSTEKVELLKILADDVVNRLNKIKSIQELSNNLASSNHIYKTLAINIREPLAGIIGLLHVITDKMGDSTMDEVLADITLIQKNSNAILSLTDEVLHTEEELKSATGQINLIGLKNKLEALYKPSCLKKDIDFKINISARTAEIYFLKDKLLQITGNLISYAINFTPGFGSIILDLTLKVEAEQNILHIALKYSAAATDIIALNKLLNDKQQSRHHSEQALLLVKNIVDSLNGEIGISAEPGAHALFNIRIPQNNL